MNVVCRVFAISLLPIIPSQLNMFLFLQTDESKVYYNTAQNHVYITDCRIIDQQAPLSATEGTPIVLQLCMKSRIGLWGKYYYALYDITHYFSSDVGFTNIVVWSMGHSSAEMKYRAPTV